MNTKKILFVPDVMNGEDSGARSARSTIRSLLELGYVVGVYIKSDEIISNGSLLKNILVFKSNSKFRFYSFIYDPPLLKEFRNIIDIFNPEYIFFAGSIQKPSILAKEARSRGIKTIFLFYINDYYCHKVYAGLETGPCFKCIEKNNFQALKNGCINRSPIYLNFIKGWIVRKQIKKELINSYRVVGYSQDQLDIYIKYGIDRNKCYKVAFQFDPLELADIHTEDHGYFLLLGQPTIEKGWHILKFIFSKLQSSVKIKILFKDLESSRVYINKYDLNSYVDSGMIDVVCEVKERSRVLSIMSSARAVIIPTYYPTTGEFVLLESLLLGKPVIVFDVGAHKEIISHNINGMIANISDYESFAGFIDEINLNSEFRESVSKGAKSWGKLYFSDEARLSSLSEILS